MNSSIAVFNPVGIPTELKEIPQWVGWRHEMDRGFMRKPPYDPRSLKRADITDSSTWGSFDQVLTALEHGGCDGAGLVVTSKLGLTGLDFDHCRHSNGQVED